MIQVVVVTYNSGKHIGPCLASIEPAGATVIVVDNGSTDTTEGIVAQYHGAKYIKAGANLGYGKSTNLGFRETKGAFVVLSNPDVVYPLGEIEKSIEFLRSHPGVGIIGVQQVFPDGSWQRSYGDLPSILSGLKDATGYSSAHHWIRRAMWPKKVDRRPKEVPYVDGGVLVVRADAFRQIDGFDEAFFFYSEEADLCRRMRNAGWKVMFVPTVQVVHARGASANAERSDKYLRYLVASRMLLAQRCIPGWQAKIYAWLESVYFSELVLIYRLLQVVGGDRDKRPISDKIWTFTSYVNIWREYLKQGCISNSYR